jgi:2-oxoglutarate ferredoxin oxidoreductase subunit beta
MKNAIETLNWIDSITLPLRKWEQLSYEEKLNVFPTGVLREVEQEEYFDMYKEIQAAAQGKRAKLTRNDFKKKI